jgi:cytochrome P450
VVSYLEDLLERSRAENGSSDSINEKSGLVSALLGHRDKGVQLTDTEIISLVVLAGLTSQGGAHLIGDAVVALLTHPDQLGLLRENPDLLPKAVHELIRWTTPSPVAANVRYPTEDVEIAGTLIRKGEAVAAVLVAANYDPRKFDEPDRLDITREPDRRSESHVSFGVGAHLCMGAALIRLTGEVAFGGLLRRYPGLSLAVSPNDLEYRPMAFHNVLTALPVRL